MSNPACRNNWHRPADRLARIPQAGRADSLNLAVATAVMLFEARRPYLTLEAK